MNKTCETCKVRYGFFICREHEHDFSYANKCKHYKCDENKLEQMFGLPYLQSMIDNDIKQFGYISSLTLRYIGNFGNLVITKELKVKAAE